MPHTVFKPTTIRRLLAALALVGAAAAAWAGGGGVIERYQRATAPFDATGAVAADLSLPIDTVLVTERHRGRPFATETRKDKIERFRCSRCHIGDKAPTVLDGAQTAHGTIALAHGSPSRPLSCNTCHSADDRDMLVTEEGVPVDMDHSYQLCGQCHFRQKKDWVGGAHGKRVRYWAGQRVVKNCTSCHNPHAPRFEKRWPATYSPAMRRDR